MNQSPIPAYKAYYIEKTMFQPIQETDEEEAFYYDEFLSRLAVSKYDSFCGISPNIQRLDYNPSPPLFACRFAEAENYQHIAALANEDGRVAIQDTTFPHNDDVEHPAFSGSQCHTNAVFDLVWVPGSMSFVTVSGDHTAKLWNVNGGDIDHVRNFHGHKRSVRTAAFQPDEPSVFATGARDGKVMIWDTRVSSSVNVIKADNIIHNCHPFNVPKTPGSGSKRSKSIMDRANSVTGLVFKDNNTLISCGSGDGSIRVWDMRKNYSNYRKDPLPKHSIPYCGSSSKNGYSSLILDKSRIRLYASCVDNVIYCFNVSTYNVLPEQKYIGHENGSFYIKSSLSPDSNYLISGSTDENAYIWNIKYREPIVKLAGHDAEVTCATWCQVGYTKIITCSDDSRHKIWRIDKEEMTEHEISELYGIAHKLSPVEKKRSRWDSLDKTPQATKRRMAYDQDSSTRKRIAIMSSDNDNNPIPGCSYSNTRKSKRNLFDMRSKDQSSTDLVEHEIVMKRQRFDSDSESSSYGSPFTSKSYSTNKRKLSVIPENTPITDIYNSGFTTPVKSSDNEYKTQRTYYQGTLLTSPTMNLPNFVTDGKAPHLRIASPPKKAHNVDWLTKLRKDKSNGTENKFNTNQSTDPQSPAALEKPKQSATLLDYFSSNTIKINKNTPDKIVRKPLSPMEDKINRIPQGIKRKSIFQDERNDHKIQCHSSDANSPSTSKTDGSNKKHKMPPQRCKKITILNYYTKSFNNVENKP